MVAMKPNADAQDDEGNNRFGKSNHQVRPSRNRKKLPAPVAHSQSRHVGADFFRKKDRTCLQPVGSDSKYQQHQEDRGKHRKQAIGKSL